MVFLITEVLEGVLLQLEPQDILRVQRVCCRWRDVIVQSSVLQQKLFLQPISSEPRQAEFNPMLKALFPPCFGLQGSSASAEALQQQDWFQDEDRRKAVLRPEASWRRMLPVQPPARISEIEHNEFCCLNEAMLNYEKISAEFEYLQQEGARMGLIFDIVVHLLDDFAVPYFFIRWHMFPTLETAGNEESTRLEDVESSVLETEGEGEGLENKITMHAYHRANLSCNTIVLVDSGLRVVDFDPKLLENTDPYVYVPSDDEDVDDC